jgi:hypothetical protein
MFHNGSEQEASKARGQEAREAKRGEACWNGTVSTVGECNDVDAGLTRLVAESL